MAQMYSVVSRQGGTQSIVCQIALDNHITEIDEDILERTINQQLIENCQLSEITKSLEPIASNVFKFKGSVINNQTKDISIHNFTVTKRS